MHRNTIAADRPERLIVDALLVHTVYVSKRRNYRV